MNTKAFLRSLREDTPIDSVLASLEKIKTLAEDPQSSNDDVKTAVDTTTQNVLVLKSDIDKLNRVLALYQKTTDSVNIPALKVLWDSTINNYTSAYNATITYDKNWFANSMFSQNGKIELASYLLNSIKMYCKDNTETLQLISNLDDDIISYIYWPRINNR